MDCHPDFYTFRGYSLKDAKQINGLSPSMEDYLEMILRLSQKESYARVLELAESLHVKPPSASRMLQRMARKNLVRYEKYGVIQLTDQGKEIGEKLMERHILLEQFFQLLGVENALEDTERIEHSLSARAVECIDLLVRFFSDNPAVKLQWEQYRKNDR